MNTIRFLFTALFSFTFSLGVAEEFQFKPAQTNLTSIFLRLANSLEQHGSPVPYCQHILAEHERIRSKYSEKHGKEMGRLLPSYFTADYITTLEESWTDFEETLQLPRLATKTGQLLRLAINGENGTGTTLVMVFNEYQDPAYSELATGKSLEADLGHLSTELLRIAEDGDARYLASREAALSEKEQSEFRKLLEKNTFSKTDFQTLERFYNGPYDRLTEFGKSQISKRVFAGQRGTPVTPSEAARYSRELYDMYSSIFHQLEEQLPQSRANELESWIKSVINILNHAIMAELRLGFMERALDRKG
ncbi:MAG: hypothetical protein CMO55_16980 [Verrucomicrobiales bacterium]|nr:hypothetical protein [Verrucomicrobiales bacterium]